MRDFISEDEIGFCDQQLLIWDGCDFSIDYLDVSPDTGSLYFANGSKPEKWELLIKPDERLALPNDRLSVTFPA